MSDKDIPAPQSAPEATTAIEQAENRQALLDAAKKSMSENDALYRRLAGMDKADRSSEQ